VYGGLLTKFFHETDEDGKRRTRYPELSWIHDIACKRYGDAAEALLAVNDDTSDLAQKHVSLLCRA
jgi:nuclear pore complex protein Nup133